MTKVWGQPLWKPLRPFCLSRIEAAFLPGSSSDGGAPTGVRPPGTVTVTVAIAEDPAEGPHAAYEEVVSAEMIEGTASELRVVKAVPWGIGPVMIPAGWWVGVFHDSTWGPPTGEKAMGLTVQLHGTAL